MELKERQTDSTAEASQVVRQHGDSQTAFRQALQGPRIGRPSVANWQLLTTRVRGSLTHAEVESFCDAVRIYPTKARVAVSWSASLADRGRKHGSEG
ncbi:hypothetical protein E4U58_004978 [Claviceps cyperi]|nr:hypothetical protein E4U58_004978 [Claviceps cyperi]